MNRDLSLQRWAFALGGVVFGGALPTSDGRGLVRRDRRVVTPPAAGVAAAFDGAPAVLGWGEELRRRARRKET